jgi:hypothetical protein
LDNLREVTGFGSVTFNVSLEVRSFYSAEQIELVGLPHNLSTGFDVDFIVDGFLVAPSDTNLGWV